MIEIESGCVKVHAKENTWSYSTVEQGKEGNTHVVMNTYVFISNEGERPVVGDFIEAGKLVKRTKPKVNADWSRWKDKDLYGNP